MDDSVINQTILDYLHARNEASPFPRGVAHGAQALLEERLQGTAVVIGTLDGESDSPSALMSLTSGSVILCRITGANELQTEYLAAPQGGSMAEIQGFDEVTANANPPHRLRVSTPVGIPGGTFTIDTRHLTDPQREEIRAAFQQWLRSGLKPASS